MAISGGLAQRLDGISRLAGGVGVMLYRGFHRVLLLLFMIVDPIGGTESKRKRLPKSTLRQRRFV